MRILDKNNDFYDYLQNVYRDTSLTFDRTDSFLVTKEMMLEYFNRERWRSCLHSERLPYRFVLLQVCNTFWLFLAKMTKFSSYDYATDYALYLLHNWKNYSKTRVLIQLKIISFDWHVIDYTKDYECLNSSDENKEHQKTVSRLIDAIDHNNYEIKYTINSYRIYYESKGYNPPKYVEKHIPLLIACGLGNLIDPLDMYLSIEEYLSLEKQSSERSESFGLTDIEKVENHGFDRKISFRGKT